MSKTYITGANIYQNHHFINKDICIENGKIYLNELPVLQEGDTQICMHDKWIVPGFIDVHTHGAVGVDVNGADTYSMEKIGHFFAQNGTTSFLASVLTDTEQQTRWCIDQMKAYNSVRGNSAELLGIHLEGPFLAKEYKGAMPEHLLKNADFELLRSYQEQARGLIKYITVSPEVEGILEMIPLLYELGIQAAMGHSGADYQTSMKAVKNGICCSTHTCNAMRLIHQHEPAILGAVLETDIYAEMICDGRHLHPGIVRLLLKTKGYDKMIAVTDSIMAAGLPDGNYHLGVNTVVVENGDAKLASDGTRAGSTLTQIQAFHNLLNYTKQPIEKIIPLLTENPANMLGIGDRKGFIDDGRDADLVILDKNYEIEKVFVQGRIITA